MSTELVLVTGGSGFVGAHCIVQLLNAGYRVRTTVRTREREADVRAMLAVGGADLHAPLEVVVADLTADAHWPHAVAGCTYVLHVASPFTLRVPRHEDDLIAPARDGTLRVLRASLAAGVKRVVLTSSFVAIAYGHPPTDQPFTEATWTNLAGTTSPYIRSKTVAEQAAWQFIASATDALELAVINPVGVFGPVLGRDYSEPIDMIRQLLDGAAPGLPRMAFGMVDVRDVAELHLRAMVDPAANGERFIAVAGESHSLRDIATVLKQRLGPAAARVPTRELPDWTVRLAARVVPSLRPILLELGQVRNASNAKARRVLGWQPRANDDTIVATANSLRQFGVLRTQPARRAAA